MICSFYKGNEKFPELFASCTLKIFIYIFLQLLTKSEEKNKTK